MSCSRPFYLPTVLGANGKPCPIPCGYCLSCRIAKRDAWKFRLEAEWKKSPSSFVTLTYDDNHVPFSADGLRLSVRRSDLTKYLDSLRHFVKYHKDLQGKFCDPHFKYFAVSEYGEDSDRPHYHVLFFGLDYHHCSKIFDKVWKGGFVDVKPIQDGGIRYVLKYLDKNGSFDKRDRIMNYQEPNFHLMSKGLGVDVMKAQVGNVSKYGAMKFGSRYVSMPVYYRNKFVPFSDGLVEAIAARQVRYSKSPERLAAHEKGLLAKARRANEAAMDYSKVSLPLGVKPEDVL